MDAKALVAHSRPVGAVNEFLNFYARSGMPTPTDPSGRMLAKELLNLFAAGVLGICFLVLLPKRRAQVHADSRRVASRNAQDVA
jgi:hypothetical protein